jgi:hypothetical protein
MLSTLRNPAAVTLFATMVALLGGCGEDSSGPGDVEVADVNEFLTELPTWEEFSPLKADADDATGDPEVINETVDGTEFNCTTTPYSITRTPDKIVTMNPDHEILWPGSLLQGKGYAEGIGALAELPIRERAPLAISIDLLTQDNTRTVEKPTLASVNSAIGELIQAASDAGHTAGSNVLYTKERMHSVSQGLLKMGLSAKYTGAEISSNLEVSYSAERTNVTAYFIQLIFTVSVVLPSTPQAFFSSSLTAAKLQEQVDRGRIGADNLPVFVSNISYGRMLVFSLSSDKTEAEINATLNVVLESGGNGGGANLTAEQKALLENSQIKVVTVGGDASHALALIRSGNLSEFFQTDASLTSARPISYTVRNLADNSIAKVSETTEYSLRQCAPVAMVPTGAKYRITMQQLTYVEWGGLTCGGLCPLITGYDFYVNEESGQTHVATYDPTVGAAICSGNSWPIQWNGGAARDVEVTLHKDGRDSVRFFGNIRQVSPFVSWDLTYRNQMPTGNLTYTRWDSPTGECWRFRVTFNVTKVEDVFD